jgi:hypothetical protein
MLYMSHEIPFDLAKLVICHDVRIFVGMINVCFLVICCFDFLEGAVSVYSKNPFM